jgi:hypothetical protein
MPERERETKRRERGSLAADAHATSPTTAEAVKQPKSQLGSTLSSLPTPFRSFGYGTYLLLSHACL